MKNTHHFVVTRVSGWMGALLFALTHRLRTQEGAHLRNEDVFQLLSLPPHLGLGPPRHRDLFQFSVRNEKIELA